MDRCCAGRKSAAGTEGDDGLQRQQEPAKSGGRHLLIVFMVQFLVLPVLAEPACGRKAGPRGSRSVCSLSRRSEVVNTLNSPSRRSSSGSVSEPKRLTSAPHCVDGLPALALVFGDLGAIFSPRRRMRPMRSSTAPICAWAVMFFAASGRHGLMPRRSCLCEQRWSR